MKRIPWAIAFTAFALSAFGQNIDYNVNCVKGCSGSSTGASLVPSASTESNHVLKASAGSLSALTVTIGATSGWVLVFDAASAPSNGAVTPKWWFPVTSDGTKGGIAVSWPVPVPFSTGITAVFSTTGPFTQTLSATAQFSGQVQ